MAVDATLEDSSYGRLINHSSNNPNVFMKVETIAQTPAIVFVALKDIPVGQEIQYDYGEKRKAVLLENPWLP